MGFSLGSDFYDAGGDIDGEHDILQEYLRYRFDEGMTVQETAQRMGVDLRDAKIMEHRALRLGRPVL
jgi:DNA-directed RNA polymerase specialized sigma24 family protein